MMPGSRTMWNSVEAEPILTSDQSQYEKVVALQVNGVKVLFVTTSKCQLQPNFPVQLLQ